MLDSEETSRYFVVDETRACRNQEQDRRSRVTEINIRQNSTGCTAHFVFLLLCGGEGCLGTSNGHACGRQPGRDGPRDGILSDIRIPFLETCID